MEIADLHLVVAVLLAEILVVDHQVLMEVEAVVLVLLVILLLVIITQVLEVMENQKRTSSLAQH